MSDIRARIAKVLREHYYQATAVGPRCWCGTWLSGIDAHPAHVADVLAEQLGLTQEERWVPVAQSGERWMPRSEAAAQRSMRDYPAGGAYPDGEWWDGVIRIDHECRYVTPWVRADGETGGAR